MSASPPVTVIGTVNTVLPAGPGLFWIRVAAWSGTAREHPDAGVGRSVGFRTIRGQRRRL